MQHSRYELIRHLAAGGMGEVFVARLVGAGDFEKKVALKLLQPHLTGSPDLVARFYAEARLAALMHHPNIVEIFDVGESDGRPFIAMQFVDGVSLHAVIKRMRNLGQRMPLPLVRLVAVGLCEALTYAHTLTDAKGASLKVVHRDVTPSNVMVSTAGAVLLMDFGIARVRDGGPLTEPGVVRGKVAYLAPEQVLHNAPVDARADLYAAALSLYELLCGENPIRAPSPAETLSLVSRGAIPPVASKRSDVTAGMAAAIEKSLRAAPGDRFPTVRAFREAFIDGPVATGPELAGWVQHHFGAELAAFAAPPAGQTGSYLTVTPTAEPGPARASAVTDHDPIVLPTPARTRLVAGALIALLVGAGATGAWLWAQEAPATDPAPPAAASRPEPARAPPPAEPVEPPRPDPEVIAPPAGPALDAGTHAHAVAARPARPPSPPAATPQFGLLTVDAVPWADVLEGGVVLDRTPFARHPLPIGRHTLVFKGPGGKLEQRVVDVAADRVTMVRVEFK